MRLVARGPDNKRIRKDGTKEKNIIETSTNDGETKNGPVNNGDETRWQR